MTEALSPDRPKADFGVIGLGTMGGNLALNLEERGLAVAVWNRSPDRTDRLLAENAGRRLSGTKSLEALVAALDRPRRLWLMVPAGEPVDATIGNLRPLLEPGDLVIDGANSWFEDTRRRDAALREAGFLFLGCGVSGGEEGARHGPSLMPGGTREAYESAREAFEAIAAKTEAGPCVALVGPDGAGHFVKMVHNGIEYGVMQGIAEVYDLLRRGLGLEAGELAAIFAEWNRGPLESFLVDLASRVLAVRDEETGRPLVDLVEDRAQQKGTGRWTVRVALDLGVAVPTLAAGVDARVLSSRKEAREAAAAKVRGPRSSALRGKRESWTRAAHDALLATTISAFSQGMDLIGEASEVYHWGIDRSEIARIWMGGCILRARLLGAIRKAYRRRPPAASLLLDSEILRSMRKSQTGWRRVVGAAARIGVPFAGSAASLAYFDSLRSQRLPQNLTQAQRDAFGAHGYRRVDRPEEAPRHTDWLRVAPIEGKA